MSGPVLYESDKTMPWNYDGDIYYHGIKQDRLAAKEISSKEEDSDISNISGTSKITRRGRIFSPEIAHPKAVFGPVDVPKVTSIPIIISASAPNDKDDTIPAFIPTNTSTSETQGKNIQEEHVRTKAQLLTIPEASKKEMEDILRIIKKRDYDVVE